eukprot:CAMPEP_0114420236 /NCGR_PEP_ID=MMETSP0103-20121206/4451_1 /TAXON_ID=37642 ORGANISM="Paraphysomonas imperforata, Strain PA2" /NCGR_SAMPLE_ID=MMETSP0103 /ASSEMBLY_ACC=CAM_ASM_000201 /LENGTH=763 /DNA_ID=CAMNT_0001588705 /DNA_START=97 /DNA_END=2388 /DNA_ORIENTATION=+
MTLDEQVVLYSNNSFDAEAAARNFFSDHSENEVHQKLNELANLQNQIETSLRQKVRDNYSLFMFANDEINRVGEEMSDLKHLLTSTKKMLEELRMLRPGAEDVAGAWLRRGGGDQSPQSLEEGRVKAGLQDYPHTVVSAPSPDNGEHSNRASSIPSWVANTPHDIERCIVEQQYSKATALVVRALAYLDSVKEVGGNEVAIGRITDAIQRNRLLLAQTLRDSLAKLSSSELFGAAEQTKRLKLLISLGHSALAAQGFATGRKDVIRKALRYVEASGDPAAFTAELSRVFFVNLRDACQSFLDLFSKPPSLQLASSSSPAVDGSDRLVMFDESDVASLSYLVGWLQDQMTVFVSALARQIQVGAAEYAAEVFQLPMSALLKTHDGNSGADVASHSSSVMSARLSVSPNNSLKRASSLLHQVLTTPGESSVMSRGVKRVSSVSRVPLGRTSSARASVAVDSSSILSATTRATEGPLTFTSRCLQVAFREAVVLDRLGLQGASSLSWNMMPEIKAIVNSFADDIIKDIENKVLQDDWVKVKCTNSEVTLPCRAATKKSAAPATQSDPDTTSKPKRGLSSLFGGISNVEDDDDNIIDTVENTLSGDISIYTSTSYQWVSALLTYFIGEVYSLLLVQPPASEAVHSPSPRNSASGRGDTTAPARGGNTYSRVDLCELEPEAVACILRILIRYVRAVISLDLNSLSHSQRECFHATVEEIKVSLLPSAEDVILKGFFSDGSTLVATPPRAVLKHLRASLQAAAFREVKD